MDKVWSSFMGYFTCSRLTIKLNPKGKRGVKATWNLGRKNSEKAVSQMSPLVGSVFQRETCRALAGPGLRHSDPFRFPPCDIEEAVHFRLEDRDLGVHPYHRHSFAGLLNWRHWMEFKWHSLLGSSTMLLVNYLRCVSLWCFFGINTQKWTFCVTEFLSLQSHQELQYYYPGHYD